MEKEKRVIIDSTEYVVIEKEADDGRQRLMLKPNRRLIGMGTHTSGPDIFQDGLGDHYDHCWGSRHWKEYLRDNPFLEFPLWFDSHNKIHYDNRVRL